MRLRLLVVMPLLLLLAPSVASEEKEHPDVARLLRSIRGKEHLPAGEVFKNVQILKNVPAGRFLRLMDSAYSRGLGVNCEHCHSESRWEADEIRAKRAAREMAVLVRQINQSLGQMQDLDDSNPSVNCTVCHRGKLKPAGVAE